MSAPMTDSLTQRRILPADSRFSCWTAPDGWQHRRFDWPHPSPRGRILVQGGRADVVEKFLEVIHHLHGAGWSVTAFDWRGQGGSGRLSPDPRTGHAASFDPWVADLGDFWRDWRGEGAGPAALLGHSMGGFLGLRALVEQRIDPQALVLVAPMLGVRSPVGQAAGRWLAALMTRIGDPARPAWRVREDARSAGHRQRLLTHCADRYGDEAYWYGQAPDLLLGPPSWAWVREALVACARLQHDARLAEVTTPTLMLVAEADGLVDPRAALRVAARLPRCELVRFGSESAHEILREEDAVRLRAFRLIDAFLAAHAA